MDRILIATEQFSPAVFGRMATHAYTLAEYLEVRRTVLVS